MLVLSRKVGQELVIGDSVRVTVTKIVGNRITLGVEAPDAVRVMRAELEQVAMSFEPPAGTSDEQTGRATACRRKASLVK